MKLSGREHIILPSTSQLSASAVLSWLHGRLLSRVEAVEDVKQLEQVWLNTTIVQEKKVPWHALLQFLQAIQKILVYSYILWQDVVLKVVGDYH